MVWIMASGRKPITQRAGCLLKGNPMLALICFRLSWVPLKAHDVEYFYCAIKPVLAALIWRLPGMLRLRRQNARSETILPHLFPEGKPWSVPGFPLAGVVFEGLVRHLSLAMSALSVGPFLPQALERRSMRNNRLAKHQHLTQTEPCLSLQLFRPAPELSKLAPELRRQIPCSLNRKSKEKQGKGARLN